MAIVLTGPDGPIRFNSAMPALEFNASGNVGPVEWSVNYGAMAPAVGVMSVLSPLNLTRTVIVTGKDTGTDPWTEATATLEIEGTFPVIASRGVESDVNPGFEVSIPEAGPPKFRILPRTAQWPLVFRVRQFMDYVGARDFLIAHETLPFWYEDFSLGELRKVYQDSALRRSASLTNLLEYAVQVRDYDYQPPANIADLGPWAPSGGGELPDYGEGEYGG